MSETQQYGKRWEDLPADEQLEGYWLAISTDCPDCWGDLEYETVYVSPASGKIIVWVVGEDECEELANWRFLRRLDLPKSAAEVVEQDERERDRNGVEVPVTADLFRDVLTRMKAAVSDTGAAAGEIADDLFPLPKTLRSE